MFRSILLAFVLGWGIWLWVDKNPAALGAVPYPADGEYLQNFQVAIDLIKQSRFKAAFIYIWHAHYVVLSLSFGLLLAMLGNTMARAWSRKRFRKLYIPDKKQKDSSDLKTENK